jgi:cytoskeletal protein CcmA (bactofilin family)
MKFRRKSSEEISGFLDQGTHVTGELQFAGHMRIDGNFHGSISTPDTLIVGEHAVVHADIKTGEIEVHGRVFGNIESSRRVEIYPTGRVRGDIKTPIMVINQGGVFDGRSGMVGDADAETPSVEARDITSKELDEAH